jgi:hypothetical protein
VRRHRSLLSAVIIATALLWGCGDDDGGSASTSTTSLAPTAPVALRGDGLGVVAFGASVDDALAAIGSRLGPPDDDRTASGDRPDGLGDDTTTVRTVRWGALAVTFLDWRGSPYRSDGAMHLARWIQATTFGSAPPAVTGPDPVALGDTAADVRAALPGVVLAHDDCVGAWTFTFDAHGTVFGRLDGPPEVGTVSLLTAGLQSSC